MLNVWGSEGDEQTHTMLLYKSKYTKRANKRKDTHSGIDKSSGWIPAVM